MMPSPPIDDCPDTRYSCWLAAGSAQARIGPLDWPAVAPSILSCNVQSIHFHRRKQRPSSKASASTTAIQPQQAQTRGEIPIAPAAPAARPTAISCLGAFRTPATGARGWFVIPASENLHMSGHAGSQLQCPLCPPEANVNHSGRNVCSAP